MRVYLDLAVLLNVLVDLLLLLGTNRLAGRPPGWKRSVPAAVLGGIYGGMCLLPGLAFLGKLHWRLVFLGLMGTIAFGIGRQAWIRCGLFTLLSMSLAGIALAVGVGGFWMPVLSAGAMWLLCRVCFRTAAAREYVPLEIVFRGRKVRLTALRDTGNTLRDPVTGEQVLVIGPEAAAQLTGLTQSQLRAPLDTMTLGVLPGLRLIPYRAVGQPGGMMLGMRFREVTLGGSRGAAVVAFASEQIGGKDGYEALTGGVI